MKASSVHSAYTIFQKVHEVSSNVRISGKAWQESFLRSIERYRKFWDILQKVFSQPMNTKMCILQGAKRGQATQPKERHLGRICRICCKALTKQDFPLFSVLCCNFVRYHRYARHEFLAFESNTWSRRNGMQVVCQKHLLTPGTTNFMRNRFIGQWGSSDTWLSCFKLRKLKRCIFWQ